MKTPDAYVKSLENNLNRIKAEIDMWKAKTTANTSGATTDILQQIDNLNEKKRVIEKRLQEMKAITQNNLKMMKSRVREEWKDMTQSVKSK